jgi:phosphate transport system protein
VQDRDEEVDRREVEVEEDCLKVLALYQPVAVDLRLIIATLKINNDLERIGDLAVNIARKATAISALPPGEIPFDLESMSDKTQLMLRGCLDALVNMDTEGANEVCARDDEIDRMKHDLRLKAQEMIRANPSHVEFFLNLLAVSRNLERIADLATNIAEGVIYMAEGRIVRHSVGM